MDNQQIKKINGMLIVKQKITELLPGVIPICTAHSEANSWVQEEKIQNREVRISIH